MRKKILLLGSGELGKEFVIACQRLGQYIIAVDSYEGAPAMQVAHEFEVINMLDGDALDRIVAKHQPDLIVPEIEAIRTERFYDYEKLGIQVVPSAKAANFTMNRKAIRDLAAIKVGVRTATYRYATIESWSSSYWNSVRGETVDVKLWKRTIGYQMRSGYSKSVGVRYGRFSW
jgi:phosphoribosylglycinamide formyltransferase 2